MRRRRTALSAVVTAVLVAGAGCAAGRDEGYVPVAPPPSGALCRTPAPAITTLDFESARQQNLPDDPPPGWSAQYDMRLADRPGGPPVRIVRAPDPVRAGGAAARFELRRDDPVINEGTRAELAGTLEPPGADRWYAFSIYLPKSWARDRSPEILAQWHQRSLEGNPPLAIATYKGTWEILATSQGHAEDVITGAYRTGRWTDWLVHVKWSAGADGLVQVWQDGRPIAGLTAKRGPNSYPDKGGVYLKVGIYKWDWSKKRPSDTTKRLMFLDELRVASTRAGVAIPAPPAKVCYRPDASTP
jgi:hypothetical protein